MTVAQLRVAINLIAHPRSVPTLLQLRVLSSGLRGFAFKYVDWRDRTRLRDRTRPRDRRSDPNPLDQVPPAALRYRVHGDLDLDNFLQTGKQLREDMRRALARVDREVSSFQNILDFGCGCGRTLIGFSTENQDTRLYGTDIDADAIAWCRAHLTFAQFQTNTPLPPLAYAAETFDLVYAISVFTHLNEDYQFRWLEELQRVTQSRGYVLLTLHGAYYWSTWSPVEIEEIKRRGFTFRRAPKEMQGLFPEWYQTAYHTPEYVLANYAKYFDVREYLPSALDGCHDIVILQKS